MRSYEPKAVFALSLLIACWAGSIPPASSAGTPRIAVRAARLLDPASGSFRRDVVVIVDGPRIADIVPSSQYRIRAGDRVIELGDATLLPGLIDAHVHLSIAGPPRVAAPATVAAGFTTVADLGAGTQRIQVVRDTIASGDLAGPRVLAAGLWVGVKGGVCDFGGTLGVADQSDAYRARVRENIAAGANLIKVCVTGWPAVAYAHLDSAELTAEHLAAIVDEAHHAGRAVVAHALSRAGVQRALDAGVDGLAHTPLIDDALAARMRERGLWLIPTLASLTGGDTTVVARALVDAVRVAHRNGVMLVYGTDAGVIAHGTNASEAAALHAAGVPAPDILRAATVNAARALGIADSVGTLERGMAADLVAVAGNPLVDVTVLARPLFVMARGAVVAPRASSAAGDRTRAHGERGARISTWTNGGMEP